MAETRKTKDQHEESSEEKVEEVVFLEEEDISKGVNACTNSLYGRIFAAKTFSIGTMDNALKAIWGKPEGFKVCDMGDNKFQFFFSNEVDVIRIERGASWLFKDYVLHVKRWNKEYTPNVEIITSFPVWTQFWGLPEPFKMLEVSKKLRERIV
ncbi:uncharacterized protein LOC107619867 [Arachis ipaensis]|uniref:uncharacterized protein LOC107619867 n=1 Tax=Arachis ipaensis TaxID=130454 RepID=UPI0007AFBA26|nr:uncharacterized protein LOC107619867 [Arachis ipaensis]XP_025682140.1 uncharacterized protein LOC112783414 [Arachis hypogaea]